MRYNHLGNTGLIVSELCLGAMTFGTSEGRFSHIAGLEQDAANALVKQAFDAGVNFIDSADAYNGGQSEVVVGRAISNNRQSWILATKLANQIGDDPNRGGLSRRWVMQAAEESLKRLGTDHIDIYYLHKEDHATPLAETVRAMGDLIRQGKIRYFGLSNYRAWRVAEICNICDANGIDRPIVSQPYYNAMNRMPEVERQEAALKALDGDSPGPLVVRWNLHRGFLYQAAKQRYEPFDRLVDQDPQTRQVLARMAARAFRAGQKVWITANNKAEGCAPLSVLELAREIAKNLA